MTKNCVVLVLFLLQQTNTGRIPYENVWLVFPVLKIVERKNGEQRRTAAEHESFVSTEQNLKQLCSSLASTQHSCLFSFPTDAQDLLTCQLPG